MENVFESILGFGPCFTTIPDDVVENTKKLCTNGILDTSDADSKLIMPDLEWGTFYSEKVNRLSVMYYRLVVTERNCEHGFMLFCESLNKDRFKLVVYDSKGAMVQEEECLHSRDGNSTYSLIFFNSCTTYRLGDINPSSPDSPTFTDLSDLQLSRLDSFTTSTKNIQPGNYLVFVFGDNYIGKSSYRIIPVALGSTQDESVRNDSSYKLYNDIEENDKLLLHLKDEMKQLRTEYVEAKATYEKCIEKIKLLNNRVEQQLDKRVTAYNKLLMDSLQKNHDTHTFYSFEGTDPVGDNVEKVKYSLTESQSSVRASATGIIHSSQMFHGVPCVTPMRKKIGLFGTSNINNPMITTDKSVTPSISVSSDATVKVEKNHQKRLSRSYTTSSVPSTSDNKSTIVSFATVKTSAGWLSKTISSGFNNFILASPTKEHQQSVSSQNKKTKENSKINVPSHQTHTVNKNVKNMNKTIVTNSKEEEDENSVPEFSDVAASLYNQLHTKRSADSEQRHHHHSNSSNDDKAYISNKSNEKLPIYNTTTNETKYIQEIYSPSDDFDSTSHLSNTDTNDKHHLSRNKYINQIEDADDEINENTTFETEAANLLRSIAPVPPPKPQTTRISLNSTRANAAPTLTAAASSTREVSSTSTSTACLYSLGNSSANLEKSPDDDLSSIPSILTRACSIKSDGIDNNDKVPGLVSANITFSVPDDSQVGLDFDDMLSSEQTTTVAVTVTNPDISPTKTIKSNVSSTPTSPSETDNDFNIIHIQELQENNINSVNTTVPMISTTNNNKKKNKNKK